MKTSVVMVRKMGKFDVCQRTGDEMFNATLLLNQWNESIGAVGRKGRRIDDFLNTQSTKEFLLALSDDLLNTEDSRYLKTHETTRGKNGGTWMNPLLFIDFAMWLNPTFKLQVLKFVYDQLIQERKLAGDNYLVLSSSGVKLQGYKFSEVAKAIQWIVYGKTGKELRQTATEEQLREINEIQMKFAFAIDMNYIKTYPQLMEELREMYRIKKRKTPF
jgi:hypothetical protein